MKEIILTACIFHCLLNIPTITGIGDSKGKKFVLGFIENRVLVKLPVIRIYVTSHDNGYVNFTVPLDRSTYRVDSKRVRPGEVVMKEYPYEMHMIGTDFNTKAILVESSVEVTVQGASVNNLTTDAYISLPVEALGWDYYVMSYLYTEPSTTHWHGPSEFAVIALEDMTEFLVKPPPWVKVDFPTDFILMKYEAYQSSKYDLTGTRVYCKHMNRYPERCKKLVVISGTDWTAVSGRYMGDHLVEQLLPVDTWGAEFIVAPLATRTNGDTIRVLAAHDGTRVRVSPTQYAPYDTFQLNAGHYKTFNVSSTSPAHVIATNGVMVAQFAKSYQSDNNRLSDPMMIIAPPVQQYSTWYTFTTIQTLRTEDKNKKKSDLLFDNYLNVVIRSEYFHKLKFDGQSIDDERLIKEWVELDASMGVTFTVCTLKVSEGYHIIGIDGSVDIDRPQEEAFGAHLYGFKFQEAYGLPLGQKYGKLSHECHPTLTFEGDSFDNDCDGRIDEEIMNGKDDDNDNLIDEDLEPRVITDPPPWLFTTTLFPITTQSTSTLITSGSTSTGQGEGGGDGSTNSYENTNGYVPGTIGDDNDQTDGGTYDPNNPGGTTNSGGRTTDSETGSTTGQWGSTAKDGTTGPNWGTTGGDNLGVDGSNTETSDPGDSDSTSSSGPFTDPTTEGGGNGSTDPGERIVTEAGEGEGGVDCDENPSSCEKEIIISEQDPFLSWNDIQIRDTQLISLGVFWINTFWLFDGNVWVKRFEMSKFLQDIDKRMCILIDDKIWCLDYDELQWVTLLNITEAPERKITNETMYIHSDGVTITRQLGEFQNKNNEQVINLLSVIRAWGSLTRGQRLALFWDDKLYLFGPDSHQVVAESETNAVLMLFWHGSSYQWHPMGNHWENVENGSISLSNSTSLAMMVNGVLWILNGSQWESTLVTAQNHAPGAESVVILWHNTAWFFNSTEDPIEIYQGSYPSVLHNDLSPAAVINGTVWVLGRDGNWIVLPPRGKPDISLFDPRLGASWGDSFWVFNSTRGSWYDSAAHKLALLDYQLGNKKPGLLFNGKYHAWSGKYWYLRYDKEEPDIEGSSRGENREKGRGRRRKRRSIDGNSVINMWWNTESWQLANSKWSRSGQDLIDILGKDMTDVGIIVISVDGDIWIYNGTSWGLSETPLINIWSTYSLGAVHDDYSWVWDNETLSGNNKGVRDLGDHDRRISDGKLGVIKEGTLWVYNNSQWTDPIQITNITFNNSETNIRYMGVLMNDTLWNLDGNNHWNTDNGQIRSPVLDKIEKPALLLDDTLWILDKDNPSHYSYTYIPSIQIQGITLIWNGSLWYFDEFNVTWTSMLLTQSQLNLLPGKAIILTQIWIIEGPLLTRYNTKLHLEPLYNLDIDLKMYYSERCHNFTSNSFYAYTECLSKEETAAAADNLVLIIDRKKWMFDGMRWTILDRLIKTPGEKMISSFPWLDNIGLILNNTIWVWNGSQWINVDQEIDPRDLLGNDFPIAIFRYGYFWVWKGTDWEAETSPENIQGISSDAQSVIGIGISGSSWVWNDTMVTQDPDAVPGGSDGGSLEIRVDINGIRWICSSVQCRLATIKDMKDMINDLLGKLPGGAGGSDSGGALSNSTVWIWNGTHWVESNGWGGGPAGGLGEGSEVSIYVDGKIWTWNGEEWVEGSTEELGHPGAGNFPAGDNGGDDNNDDEGQDGGGGGGGGTGGDAGGGGIGLPPGASVSWNGTIWVWDGEQWVSGNRTLKAHEGPGVAGGIGGGGAGGGGGMQVIVNGTKWRWDGSSWVVVDADTSTTNSGRGSDTTSASNNTPTGTHPGEPSTPDEHGSTSSDWSTDSGGTEGGGGGWGGGDGSTTNANGQTDGSPLGTDNDYPSTDDILTPGWGEGGNTFGEDSTEDNQMAGTSVEGITDITDNTSEDDGTNSKGTTGSESGESTSGATSGENNEAAYTVLYSYTSTPGGGKGGNGNPNHPSEPDTGKSTEGEEGKSKTVIIVVVVLLILLLLLILIIVVCKCAKRKKKTKARQKVNPSVATNAVPRPSSRYQYPPTIKPPSPVIQTNEPNLFSSFNQSPSSSTLSSSSYATFATTGGSTSRGGGKRSPRVSQAPPIDLPDLIISLPPGKHVHLKSPRLSPDPFSA